MIKFIFSIKIRINVIRRDILITNKCIYKLLLIFEIEFTLLEELCKINKVFDVITYISY